MLIALLTLWIGTMITVSKTSTFIEFDNVSKSFEKHILEEDRKFFADSLLLDYKDHWLQSTKNSKEHLDKIITFNQGITTPTDSLTFYFTAMHQEYQSRKLKRIDNHLQLLQILNSEETKMIGDELFTYSKKEEEKLEKFIIDQQKNIDSKVSKLQKSLSQLNLAENNQTLIEGHIEQFSIAVKEMISLQKLNESQLTLYQKDVVTKEELASIDAAYIEAMKNTEVAFLSLRKSIVEKTSGTNQKITKDISKLLKNSY